MTDKQPEALRLAVWLDHYGCVEQAHQAAAELRRLHALNAELVEALRKALNEFSCLPHSLGYDFTHAQDFQIAANPARIVRLLDRLEAAEKDAQRWRWLRDKARWEDERDMGPGGRWWAAVLVKRGNPTLDAAIDAAMQSEQA